MFAILLMPLLLLVGAVLAAAIGMWRAGRRRNSRALESAGGGMVAVLILAGIVFGGGALIGFVESHDPANAYEAEFGTPPSPDIKGIQVSDTGFGDSGSTRMRFTANARTVQQLATALVLRKADPTELSLVSNDFLDATETPEWWHPRPVHGQLGFVRYGSGNSFSNETRILLFDPKNGDTYYYFEGVD